MFWRFGGYASISTIDSILDKENLQLEELLDESDLIQELKSHNSKLVEFLREPRILAQLLEYVVAPRLEPVIATVEDEEEDGGQGKGLALSFTRHRSSSGTDQPEEDAEKKRNRYAFVAAEILSSDNYSIYEALLENRKLLQDFWQFLKRPTPLDSLQASYFTKVNESLFDKKTEEMLELLKSLDDAVHDMIKHVDCPMVMDLLLKIISLERTEAGQGVVEWLYTQDVIPTLLSFLGPEHSWSTQTSAGDFMKAIITVSANASQNEQTCIGPNELTRQLVSKPCVEQLINYMLGGGNPLTVGVGIIIEVIRKNNSDYDPDGPDTITVPSSRDPIYLGTLLRLFANHVPDFMKLVMQAPAQRQRIDSTFGRKIEPLGFDRFKTCELMAELLHCSNMGLLNEPGAEELIATRDADRARLREEGRLSVMRGGEALSSVDDLTVRLGQTSIAEPGRKLEVTNSSAEDDGFEEVTHAGDDDASHGVEDMPDLPDFQATTQHQPSKSFSDKDEDDFVDEPLSSPRLQVRELEKIEEGDSFEDQDLMVAPLSPRKHTVSVEPTDVTGGSAVGTSSAEHSGASEETLEASGSNAQSQQDDHVAEDPPAEAQSASVSESQEPAETRVEHESRICEATSEESRSLSPHPDDTPAPLFSGQGTWKEPPETDSTEVALAAGQSTGEPSVVVGPTDDEVSGEELASNLVVGDFLKMQFVEHNVVPTILRFFFEYPWNNFLHNVVYDIVQQVFNGPMDRGYNSTLAVSLFEAADVTAQIIKGQEVSEESQRVNRTRMGYMGHLTLIAEEVVKFTERHPPENLSATVLEKVMAPDWISYVEGALAETRERDNAILGGVRPDVAMSNRAGASSALPSGGLAGLESIGLGGAGASGLADAGLNGNADTQDGSGGNGIGPFAISAGTMISGFGSSSDEEDDEEQESEEDVNNEFRAYADPRHGNSANAMSPPSIPPPPPPPPLNVPPSRARLQFAARLAMNKRNASASGANAPDGNGAEEVGTGTVSLPSVSASDRLRNPFADGDEEDDGSGSGSDDEGNGDMGADDGGVGSSGWNRGSWWRGVVRSARRGGRNRGADRTGDSPGGASGTADTVGGDTMERFGDGRDDSSDEDGAGVGEDDDIEDEEFGDFAMPEIDQNSSASDKDVASASGIDLAREKILLKPLPLHPNANRSNASPFGSLWPFASHGFGSSSASKKDERGDGDEVDEKEVEGEVLVNAKTEGEDVVAVQAADSEPEVIGEDGKKIDRAIEAMRRTSIEDPDDDDDGEEIIVGRPGPN